jgi:propanediol dehydratase small subunit
MKEKLNGIQDYPLGSKRKDLLTTFTGKNLADITLTAIMNGEVTDADIRISGDTLLLQARIAELTGRTCLAENFRRAAELCCLPDDKVLEIYNALRPFRCTAKQLEALAIEMEDRYQAVLNAKLLREAACAYQERGLLKTDPQKHHRAS